MELAPDFFPYFEATGRLLASDPTLYCISSWNDHGQAKFVRDERQLYRSDFFPGLGWMLTKAMWMEARYGCTWTCTPRSLHFRKQCKVGWKLPLLAAGLIRWFYFGLTLTIA